MKQGTVSVLFGSHSIIHSIIVLASWIRVYGIWPEFWQIVCIFIHDIGHWGKDYLDNYEEKLIHWEAGAKLGRFLFGEKAFLFLAGHCTQSGYEKSELYIPDKYSWYLAPRWWLHTNLTFEPKLLCGLNRKDAIDFFQKQVKLSIERGEFVETHSFFMERWGSER